MRRILNDVEAGGLPRLGIADPEWLADGRAAFFAVFGFDPQ